MARPYKMGVVSQTIPSNEPRPLGKPIVYTTGLELPRQSLPYYAQKTLLHIKG
jgi:hypothetical protein